MTMYNNSELATTFFFKYVTLEIGTTILTTNGNLLKKNTQK